MRARTEAGGVVQASVESVLRSAKWNKSTDRLVAVPAR